MYRLALIAILSILVPGCGLFTTKTVERIEYRPFDDAWLVPCAVIPPPDKNLYIRSSERVRAILWAKVYTEQVTELNACRARQKAARDYNEYLKGMARKLPTVH